LRQHPWPQRHDQAAFLGQRDELAGGGEAAIRLRPAHQCFGADDAPLGIDLGLQVQAQPPRVDGIAQRVQPLLALAHGGLHLGVEEGHAVASPLLDADHGQVGGAQHGCRVLRLGIVVTKERDAHAARQSGRLDLPRQFQWCGQKVFGGPTRRAELRYEPIC